MSATHPAFFLGRAELLGWINETLGTRVAKVEDTCNGSIACQMMDALHPGVVPLKKVDFNAKDEYSMINNYKVLQEVFNKVNVDKYIEVNKLIKGKPLDNTEFLQWLKMYYDTVTNGQAITDYDGAARRAVSKSGDIKSSGSAPVARPPQRAGADAAKAAAGTAGAAGLRRPTAGAAATGAGGAANGRGSPIKPKAGQPETSAQLEELRAEVEALKKEKSFYYSKLRDVELLCQTPTICDIPIMKRVESILYAATEEEGRQLLIDTQTELAGGVFLDDAQA
ncbi:microtubule plus-end binding protein [Haematococcus lacustris]